MPKALSAIEYGYIDKDGKNVVTSLKAGEDVAALPKDVIKSLQEAGAIEKPAAAEAKQA